MVKKIHLGFTGLLLAISMDAFASLPMFNQYNSCAYVPMYCGGFKFGLEGLYLKPSTPHLDYALKYNQNLTGLLDGVVLEDGLYHSVNPDYELGYRANVGYVMPCTANDINLAYTRLRQSDKYTVFSSTDFALFSSFFSGGSNDLSVDVDVVFPGELDFILPVTLSVPITTANMTARFDYEVWDLEFGQDIRLGCAFKMHWFGGLRFGQLEQQLNAFYEGAIFSPVPAGVIGLDAFASAESSFALRQKSDYLGIGPRFGTHLTYQFAHSFELSAELSGALLIGEMDSSYSDLLHQVVIGELIPVTPGAPATFSIPAIVNSTFSFKNRNETRVVPNVEGKLGVDYSYQLCNRTRTLVKLGAGWMATHYFNSFDRLSAVGANGPEFRTRNAIDVNFDGPYLRIQVNI